MRAKYFLAPLFLPLAATLSLDQKALGQKSKDEGWSELLPPGDGRDLVLETCNSCHNLKAVVHARKSCSEWAKNVNDMIQPGTQIFPEEIDPITAYLSKIFGTDVAKLVNAKTAQLQAGAGGPHCRGARKGRAVQECRRSSACPGDGKGGF